MGWRFSTVPRLVRTRRSSGEAVVQGSKAARRHHRCAGGLTTARRRPRCGMSAGVHVSKAGGESMEVFCAQR